MAWGATAATIGAQMAYPLVSGRVLAVVTVAIVLLFAGANAAAATASHGPHWAARFAGTTILVALAAEALGVHTGVPFGRYAYTSSLGPALLGVPLLVPLAWLMMAYPSFVVARLLTRRFVPLLGAVAMTSWDVFLDPQMVAAGHWRWADATPALPGVPGIPLTNFAGWLVVSAALMALLDRLPRSGGTDDGPPLALWWWTYGASVLGNAVLFGRPGVAVAGGLAMGAVAAPLALRLARR